LGSFFFDPEDVKDYKCGCHLEFQLTWHQIMRHKEPI
jgi:hypothetical protein